MTWVRLDDGFYDHPKIERVGPAAAWLHVCALCYCARHLTDGVIPVSKVTRLADVKQPLKLAESLVEAGVWLDEGDSYRIHDYHDYQPTRAETLAKQETDRLEKSRAGKLGNHRRWKHPGPAEGCPLCRVAPSQTASQNDRTSHRTGVAPRAIASGSPRPVPYVETSNGSSSPAVHLLPSNRETRKALEA